MIDDAYGQWPGGNWDLDVALSVLSHHGLGDSLGDRYDGKDRYSEWSKAFATPVLRRFVTASMLTCPRDDLPSVVRRALPPISTDKRLFGVIRDAVENLRIWRGVDPGEVASVASLTRHGLLAPLLDRQNGRCALCGVLVDSLRDGAMHLDHIIPRALGGGDPPDRSNWRILCAPCNGGKSDHLAAPSAPEWWGQPGSAISLEIEVAGSRRLGTMSTWWNPTQRMRYAALASARACQADGCGLGPDATQLHVVWRECPSPLTAAVLCTRHRATAPEETHRRPDGVHRGRPGEQATENDEAGR